MSRINTRSKNTSTLIETHPGAVARQTKPLDELRRAVLGCLLWENQFYESGLDIVERIKTLAEQVKPIDLADLAIEARNDFNLRHVPLLLLTLLAKKGAGIPHLVQDTVVGVVRRPDEMGELLALYWKDGKKPLPAQFKKGLARAFNNFDAYQLAKYDRDHAIKLRDVAFLTHPNPQNIEFAELFARLMNKSFFPSNSPFVQHTTFSKLEPPDTWEVNLSAGSNKKETFTRLLQERRLGYLALLRNLRNMEEAGVDRNLIRDVLLERKGAHKVFPFRFIAAAKACPKFEDIIDEAFIAHLRSMPKLKGKTLGIIDVSGSMRQGMMSAKSDMNRMQAASALGAILREVCEYPVIYATAGEDWQCKHKTKLVPPRHGLALAAAIEAMPREIGSGGIFLKQAIEFIESEGNSDFERVIVFTDEQDCDLDRSPLNAKRIGKKNYIINVSSYKQAITYDSWVRLEGFSEAVINYIMAYESLGN